MNLKRLVFFLSAIFVGFHLYTSIFGIMPGIGQRAIHLGLILVIFFLGTFLKKDVKEYQKIINGTLALFSLASTIYLMKIDSTLDIRLGIIYKSDILFGCLLLISLIEATRQCVGLSLSLVTGVFILYGFAGPYLPGFLNHPGLTINRLINVTYLTSDGIFGVALYASATYIVLFTILGSVFQETGVGDFFTNLATSAFGKVRGGPAKVSVIASGLFGSISGSAIANVIGTGTFTIPLMKKTGFEPEFAGAVEAAASTGGQIMPPVMGATAFLIAEIVGISYSEVAKAALMPAILYYVALLMTVDIYSKKRGIEGVKSGELPNIKELIKKLYLFTPLLFLVVMLALFNTTITKAGVWTIIITIIVSVFSKDTRIDKDKLVKIIDGSLSGAASVGIACATVGIIIGVLMSTGLGFRISSILIDLADGNTFILLVLTMLVSLILGMGMPTTAAYLVLAILVAPAMIDMGIPVLSAHMFIFYFGIISNITPPVALAAYAGAGIARCNPNKTGYKAFKLAISGFILPFMFVYNPVLLMEGSLVQIGSAMITSLFGVYLLSGATEKYIVNWNLNVFETIIIFIAAITLITPGLYTDMIGVLLFGLLVLYKIFRTKKTDLSNVKQ